MLPRNLEPELMDTSEDAREYYAMDHAAVNAQFVTDLLAALADWTLKRPVQHARTPLRILDLGAGTAQIPIEIARRASNVEITAVDAAQSMLDLARRHVDEADLADRIELDLANAKDLPLDSASFPVVISNSIVHHIAEPQAAIAEAVRVAESGGLLFHRDLVRPHDTAQLESLVDTYAVDATSYQRRLFADSLCAALTFGEIRDMVADFGFAPDTVQLSSDRHWTWSAMNRPAPRCA